MLPVVVEPHLCSARTLLVALSSAFCGALVATYVHDRASALSTHDTAAIASRLHDALVASGKLPPSAAASASAVPLAPPPPERASASPHASASPSASVSTSPFASVSASPSASASSSPFASESTSLPASLSSGVAPGSPAMRWGIVVQGPLYPQGAASWGNSKMDAVGFPAGRDMLRILATYDSSKDSGPLWDHYLAEGFVPALADSAFLTSTYRGVLNVNLQKHTTYTGLLLAKSHGCTHAMKVRGDVRVTNPRVFIEDVLGPLRTLSFLTKWVGTPRYAVEHLVAGPIDDVLEYFGPPYEEASDGRFPELFLMEELSRKRGWTDQDGPTHIKFCREVDFFYPRLPKGLYFFDHKGIDAGSDMAGPYTPYDISQGDVCLLGRALRARATEVWGDALVATRDAEARRILVVDATAGATT